MKASDVLKGAAELLVTKGWTQHTFARTAAGVACDEKYSRAACFCSMGAIIRASRMDSGWEAVELMDAVADGDGLNNLVYANDFPGETRESVLARFDAAYILALQEEGIEPEDVL